VDRSPDYRGGSERRGGRGPPDIFPPTMTPPVQIRMRHKQPHAPPPTAIFASSPDCSAKWLPALSGSVITLGLELFAVTAQAYQVFVVFRRYPGGVKRAPALRSKT